MKKRLFEAGYTSLIRVAEKASFDDDNGTFEQVSPPNDTALQVTATHMQSVDPLVVFSRGPSFD